MSRPPSISRRRLLELVGAAGMGGLAGCGDQTGRQTPVGTEVSTPTKTASPTSTDSPIETPTETAAPAVFELRNLQYPENISEGASAEIQIEIANTGDQQGQTSVYVEFGPITRSRDIELAPGETTKLTFKFETNAAPGTYELTVSEIASGDVIRREIKVEHAFQNFVDTTGQYFTLDGSQFYYNGANSSRLFAASRAYINDLFSDAQKMGLSVIRTRGYGRAYCKYWGGEGESGDYENTCNRNVHRFQKQPGVVAESARRKLDYVIYQARKYGIRLVIHFVNNFGTAETLGTMNWYVDHSETAEAHDDFYTDENVKNAYKKHVKSLLTRENRFTGLEYREDPAIMMWELANEPNAKSDPSGELMGEWIQEMSSYIKQHDSNHLVSTGQQGYYTDSDPTTGTDFIGHHQIESIDACSFHVYDDYGYVPHAPSEKWIPRHATDAHETVGKPVYAGEYGVSCHGDEFTDEELREIRIEVYSKFHDLFDQADVDGAMFYELFSDEYLRGDDKYCGIPNFYRHKEWRKIVQQYSNQVEEKSGDSAQGN